MNTNSNRGLWVWGLLAALVAAAVGCAGGYVATGNEVYALNAPPPDRVEIIGPAPGSQYFWVDGYWRWGGASYDWVPGRWVVVQQGQQWQPGRWRHNRYGWFYVQGHWR